MAPLLIEPAMAASVAPDWPGSIWIGAVDIGADGSEGLLLRGADGFTRARLLVRSGRQPLGFVELAVQSGFVAAEALQKTLEDLHGAVPTEVPGPLPPVSVILCTRDRPALLQGAVTSLLALDYPALEIVVVDNASVTDASAQVVAELGDPRVRLVREPIPGLARARNRGVLEASHDLVAFTDDDVVVDPHWLTGLQGGFNAAPDVACVCGMVPSGELVGFSQAYFDGRVTWARSCQIAFYRLNSPPAGQVLFPFQVGQFGTGANFAMRRSVLVELGGFDEALGVGSPTRGGEDIDMFVRVLLGGYALSYQPSAIVWHRHRPDLASLHEQIVGYGVGLGAWITKLCTNRRTALMVLRRGVRGISHALRMTRVDIPSETAPGSEVHGLALAELRAVLQGPFAYRHARRSGALPRPLRALPAEQAP
jgi:GT2 family glycosyltransferase